MLGLYTPLLLLLLPLEEFDDDDLVRDNLLPPEEGTRRGIRGVEKEFDRLGIFVGAYLFTTDSVTGSFEKGSTKYDVVYHFF